MKEKEYTEISIRQLSQVVPWSYQTIYTRLCRPQFNRYIGGCPNKRTIKIEYITRVLKLLYEAMEGAKFRGKLMNGG